MIEDLASGGVKRVIVAKIEPGSDLLSALEEVVQRERIHAGVILSCVGSLRKARLRQLRTFPKKLPPNDKHRLFKTVEGKPLEILSVSGNIARQADRSVIHAHITVSKVQGGEIVVLGGHLVKGNICYILVEVVIAELGKIEMIRSEHLSRKTMELTFHQ